MENFDIKKLCYELYKMDWKSKHGVTEDMSADALKNYYEEFSAISYEFSFEDYLFECGFKGQIFARFEEFLDNEYLEEEYIRKLLDNTNLINLYLLDIHPSIPKGDACKTLCFSQEEFKTLFESVFGKYNIDVGENDALYNEVYVEFDTTNVRSSIYFCGVSDDKVYENLAEALGINGVLDIHLGRGEDAPVWVVYKEDDSILVKTSFGVLSGVISPDNTYPGIDIELQPENLPEDYEGTLPRVLFEEVDGELRVLVWANPYDEDYSCKITFNEVIADGKTTVD